MDDNEKYEVAKKNAIALLERTFGKDAVVPLDIAAAVMPVLPEWQPKRRRGRKGGRP